MSDSIEIQQNIISLLEYHLEINSDDVINKDLMDYGLDSLNALYFINALEDVYKIKLDIKDLYHYPTIARLRDRVEELIKSKENFTVNKPGSCNRTSE